MIKKLWDSSGQLAAFSVPISFYMRSHFTILRKHFISNEK